MLLRLKNRLVTSYLLCAELQPAEKKKREKNQLLEQ